jgi:hypothetical protein
MGALFYGRLPRDSLNNSSQFSRLGRAVAARFGNPRWYLERLPIWEEQETLSAVDFLKYQISFRSRRGRAFHLQSPLVQQIFGSGGDFEAGLHTGSLYDILGRWTPRAQQYGETPDPGSSLGFL